MPRGEARDAFAWLTHRTVDLLQLRFTVIDDALEREDKSTTIVLSQQLRTLCRLATRAQLDGAAHIAILALRANIALDAYAQSHDAHDRERVIAILAMLQRAAMAPSRAD